MALEMNMVGASAEAGQASAQELSLPQEEASSLHRLGGIVGRSLVMQRLFVRLRQSAAHLRVVTLEGEAGTGKTLTARTLHSMGPGAEKLFVACTAARLVAGFTTADARDILEEVHGGTLLLTRLHELQTDQQIRLFDFLEGWEQRTVRNAPTAMPRQIFVSSQIPLRQLTASGRLRADLCYRLTAIRFLLPPLRERREDISILAEHFAILHGKAHGKAIRGLGPGTLPRLMSHTWPGNVRELETAMASAAFECEGNWIRPIDIPPLLPPAGAPIDIPAAPDRYQEDDPNLDRMIQRHVMAVLKRSGGNKLRAAQLLGISRSTLYRLLEEKPELAIKN